MRRNWMPLYIADFLADTMHLSAAETGAYIRLIMDYWLHDGLPDDDAKLAAIARMPVKTWRAMRPTIEAFFLDGWRHKRIDAELGKMIATSAKRQAAASKAGSQSAVNAAIARERNRLNGNGASTPRARHVNAASTPGARGVDHTTQERNITNTTSVAARDGALQQESGSATETDEKSRFATGSLAEAISQKGWGKPC